ncbi:MAG TPA: hypothetical protein VGH28_14285 [Polyangiaceae bacterium]|jgi:hypothetical protein
MGLFDSVKKAFGGAAKAAQDAVQQQVNPQQQQQQAPQQQYQAPPQAAAPVEEHEEHNHEALDLAGFDPENDEDGFWEAQLYMESEGMIAPNVTIGPADRDRTMQKYGIRDSSHWRDVKASVYHALVHKHGSEEVVNQRMMNHRMGMTQKLMSQAATKAASSGELKPVDGISLEQWAAMNAAIAQGVSLDDMLKGQGVDKARWDRASAEWNARMSRDTTFVVAQVYGNAFQNASKGKYSAFAKEANAARAANTDVTSQPPMSLEDYWSILYEQAYGAKQGKDPVETLKGCGLSIVDWCDLSAFMGYHLMRTYMLNTDKYNATMEGVKKKFEAKYPGVKADVDIQF